jgi:tryptophanyl-tRNA synthetase
VFYRQSDIPGDSRADLDTQLQRRQGADEPRPRLQGGGAANEDSGEDPDFGITMGLFSYPVLMAADILMFRAHDIPVGRDQIQHVEMARDIAQRFNHNFAELFVLPEARVDDNVAVLQGLDGRKMSKSYNNTIPLFEPEKRLRKAINKIKTNLLEPGEPKDPTLHRCSSSGLPLPTRRASTMRKAFAEGIAWGEAKKQLFELINEELRGSAGRVRAPAGRSGTHRGRCCSRAQSARGSTARR